jgi:hypothetical protein
LNHKQEAVPAIGGSAGQLSNFCDVLQDTVITLIQLQVIHAVGILSQAARRIAEAQCRKAHCFANAQLVTLVLQIRPHCEAC